jgi:pimeloyl-ACP methyl ester carboxylesterase
MHFRVNGEDGYASTGGRSHQVGRPWVVFLHGAGGNHLIWLQQARALAYDGCNVLALDLPGHYLSGGDAIAGIDNQARWALDAMSAAGCERAVLVGHSMGGPIALEAALAAPRRVAGIVFVATSATIPVNSRLIEMASEAEHDAIDAMMSWAHGPTAHLHVDSWPGKSHVNFGIDMMRRNRPGTLAVDLANCARYDGGPARARQVNCPTLCILSKLDRMTPISNGLALAQALPYNRTVILDRCGHMIPVEHAGQLNEEIRRFLREQADVTTVSVAS